MIYSPNSEGLINATIPLFEEKYGVSVELIQAGTGELVKRIQSEKNDPYADVLFGGSWSQMYDNEELWEPYVSANNDNVEDAYKNECGFITGNTLDGSVLIVNTDLIGDIEINGYEDLLNPELKARLPPRTRPTHRPRSRILPICSWRWAVMRMTRHGSMWRIFLKI